MPINHLINLDGDYAKFAKPFEEILNSMRIPFSSQPTKDGEVYTVHFQSNQQYEDFKSTIFQKVPYLAQIFNT